MTTLATFYTVQEALDYIEENNLTNAIIDQDIHSKKYHVIDMG